MALMMRGEISIYGMIAILVAAISQVLNHTYMAASEWHNRLLRNHQLFMYRIRILVTPSLYQYANSSYPYV